MNKYFAGYVTLPTITTVTDTQAKKLTHLNLAFAPMKNGETATFPIGDQAAKVFVIADKVSRGFCNNYYPLSIGTEDVVLTGKNKFHPGAGNPFRFDGVTDPEVLENRKKGNGKGIVILIVSALAGVITGLLLSMSIFS